MGGFVMKLVLLAILAVVLGVPTVGGVVAGNKAPPCPIKMTIGGETLCFRNSIKWASPFNLGAEPDKRQPAYAGGGDPEQHLMILTIRARLKRTGIEMRMVVEDGSAPATVDATLVRLLVRAHTIRARLLQDPSLSLREIAAEEGVVSSYVSRLIRLSFLAPDMVTAIFNGRHPAQLTANRLMEDTRLPLEWKAQRELFCLL
jgi:lambda repressor-like predicted transcriptional regulator